MLNEKLLQLEEKGKSQSLKNNDIFTLFELNDISRKFRAFLDSETKAKLPELLSDIINHKKLREVTNKKGKPARNIKKYYKQIEQLRSVFWPLIMLSPLGLNLFNYSQLSSPEGFFSITSLTPQSYEYFSTIDRYLNLIDQNRFDRMKSDSSE